MDSRNEKNIVNYNKKIKHSTTDMKQFLNALRSKNYQENFEFLSPEVNIVFFEENHLNVLVNYLFNENDFLKFGSSFAGGNIRKLYLGHNFIGVFEPGKIALLINGLKNLNELYLNNNDLGELEADDFKALFDSIKRTNITVLDLSNNSLLRLGINSINTIKNGVNGSKLQFLNLSGNNFDDYLPKHVMEKLIEAQTNRLKLLLIEKLFLPLLKYFIRNFIRENESALANTAKSHNSDPRFLEIMNEQFSNIGKSIYSLIKDSLNGNLIGNLLHDTQESPLVFDSAIDTIQKNLAQNRLNYGGAKYSLKELCKLTIFTQNIPYKEAPLVKELKEELNEPQTITGLTKFIKL